MEACLPCKEIEKVLVPFFLKSFDGNSLKLCEVFFVIKIFRLVGLEQ